MPLEYDRDEALAALRKADRRLARVIDRAGPLTLETRSRESPFQTLMRAIVNQQLSNKAAATIYGRLLDQFPKRRNIRPEEIRASSDEKLRSAGLSRAKTAAIKDLAAKTIDGTVPPLAKLKRMDDEAIVARLTEVRGVGPWTVEMLLIFHLGRPDVLPATDLGVRKGFMLTYRGKELPTIGKLNEHAERWRPYRSAASWYLWRAVDLHRSDQQGQAAASPLG